MFKIDLFFWLFYRVARGKRTPRPLRMAASAEGGGQQQQQSVFYCQQSSSTFSFEFDLNRTRRRRKSCFDGKTLESSFLED